MLQEPVASLIAAALVLDFALHSAAAYQNHRATHREVPADLAREIGHAACRRSRDYTRAHLALGWLNEAILLTALLGFWHVGGFGWLDESVRGSGLGPVAVGLLFLGLLGSGFRLLAFPVSAYTTLVVDRRFGLYPSDARGFVSQRLQAFAFTALAAGIACGVILGPVHAAGARGWILGWAAMSISVVVLAYLAPVWLVRFTRRLSPLGDGELRREIRRYADTVGTSLADILVSDDSERSSRLRASLFGFGQNRRIILSGSIVRRFGVDELVAVVAHELGHLRRHHVEVSLAASVLYLGLLLLLVALVADSSRLPAAFGLEGSVHAALAISAILLTPIATIWKIAVNWLARRQELAADRFAVATTGSAEALIRALVEKARENLEDLTPSRLYVATACSRPPLERRIAAARAAETHHFPG